MDVFDSDSYFGIFLLARVSSDKASTKRVRAEYEEQADAMKTDLELFRKRHEDIYLEHLVNTSEMMRSDAGDLIRSELHIARPSPMMILMTAMALQGKIPSILMEHRFGGLSDGDKYERQEQCKLQHKFLIWYNQLLRNHGVSEDLLYFKNPLGAFVDRADTIPVYEYQGDTGLYASWWSVRKNTGMLSGITYAYCLKSI